jgi:hypothetical protein
MITLKGAFVNLGAGLLGALPNIIIFQFNPETVSRTPSLVWPPPKPKGIGTVDATQQPAEPSESYSFTLRLDASDQLAQGNVDAAANGILPALSALELLMIPRSSLTIDLPGLAKIKKVFVNPPVKLNNILFFWGPFRILPVVVTQMSISETEYDQLLNPVRAEVSVTLDVLTKSMIDPHALLARGAYAYTRGVKEVMAALNIANTAQLVGGAFSLPL